MIGNFFKSSPFIQVSCEVNSALKNLQEALPSLDVPQDEFAAGCSTIRPTIFTDFLKLLLFK